MPLLELLRQAGRRPPHPGLPAGGAAVILRRMAEPNEDGTPPRYRWPWVVLAALVLAVILAVVWMSFAVRKLRQERDLNVPAPAAPAR